MTRAAESGSLFRYNTAFKEAKALQYESHDPVYRFLIDKYNQQHGVTGITWDVKNERTNY